MKPLTFQLYIRQRVYGWIIKEKNMYTKRTPESEHSRYRVCRICSNHINRVNNRSGLCQECYKSTFNIERMCIKCSTIKPASEFTPTSVYCKKCLTKYTNDKWKLLKKKAVEYKGGKCEMCGYISVPAVYDFHHINPKEKEFSIGRVRTLSLEKIIPELEQCMLLCANCHREIHFKYNSL